MEERHFERVIYQKDGAIARIILNWPQKANAQDSKMVWDFDAALKINPRLTSSLYGRGLAKKRNGSLSEGDLDINNAKAMDPNIAKEFADYGVQ